MATSELDKWIVCRKENPRAPIRLFCAPWAGASANVFNKWPPSLPNVELRAFQLPGRMSRFRETCLTTVEAIVEGVAKAMAGKGLLDKPFALFGHSMGSIVMFELAHKLTRDWGVSPEFLIVSGCRPPQMWVGRPPTVISELPRGDLIDYLVNMGGIPVEMKDKEVLNHFLPSIRADLSALESYEPDLARTPLSCPIVCLGGSEDPGVSRTELAQWEEFTVGEFRLRTFRGGHFFMKGDGAPEVLSFLGDVLKSR